MPVPVETTEAVNRYIADIAILVKVQDPLQTYEMIDGIAGWYISNYEPEEDGYIPSFQVVRENLMNSLVHKIMEGK